MTGVNEGDDEEQGSALPSVADLLRLVRKHARIIVAGPILGMAGATGFALSLTPQYHATATVMIDQRERKIVEMKSVTSDLVANTPAMESEVEIIYSRDVVSRVIHELGLAEDPELTEPAFPATAVRWVKHKLLGIEPAEAQTIGPDGSIADTLIDAFNDRVWAGRVGESYIIGITYKSKSPAKAAAIADSIADAYVGQQVTGKADAAKKATAWLDEQLVVQKEEVAAAERAVDTYKTQNGLIDTEGQLLDEKQAARHMEQLVQARNATAEARAKLQRIEDLAGDPESIASIGAVLKEQTVGLLKDQLTQASRQAAELASKYGPRHPSLIKAQAQVAEVRDLLRIEVDRIIADERAQYALAIQHEQQLEQGLDELKGQINTSTALVVQLRQLEREAKAKRDLYESFLKRAQETSRQEDLQVPDARIIDRASLPPHPASPKRIVIVLGGLFGGLMLGLMGAALLEFRSPSFVRSEQIESSLKLRHLATVPWLDHGGDLNLPLKLRQIRRILSEPHSQFAEGIRNVRVAIERSRRQRGPIVVLVASALPGEGKTVIASNLALHYALSGVRTVLVDGDLRMAGLTQELMPQPWLSLLDCIMTRRHVRDAVVREPLTGLHFVPAIGAETPQVSAAELLASPPMVNAIAALKYEFDLVVIDCPPVMPVVDASILADLADQVVFVSKWKSTSSSVSRRAVAKLAGNAHKLTGVIVNQVPEAELGTLQAYESGNYTRAPKPA